MKKFIAGMAALAGAVGAVGIAAVPASARPASPAPTIVDVAIAANTTGPHAGHFDTVLTAATCKSLDGAIVNALSLRGQRTLFAPVDSAFEKIGYTPANVCDIPAAVLADVLSYHVANGRRDAASVLGSTQIRMLNGDRVKVDAPKVQLVDGLGRKANIIVTDVPARNGVIHAIDSVLLPPGFGA
jgi:uncharacterized surface protein with fasciclin (FAS1) repeats